MIAVRRVSLLWIDSQWRERFRALLICAGQKYQGFVFLVEKAAVAGSILMWNWIGDDGVVTCSN